MDTNTTVNNTAVQNTAPATTTEGTGTNQAGANIETAIEKGKEQKENAILKSYFKQQGMEEAEIQEAIKNWKDAKAQKAIEEEKAKKEAEAQKDQAVKDAEAKAEAAMNLLKQEKIANTVERLAITLGADPAKLSLISKLVDTSTVTIDDKFIVDEASAKKAIESVLEMVPEFKQSPGNVQGFKFGATKAENNSAANKNTQNMSYREKLSIHYGN